jgi:hypothetical protein
MYARVKEGVVERIGSRPDWRTGATPNESRTLTDAELVEHGWLPVVGVAPEHDPLTQEVTTLPLSEWSVGATEVTRAWMVRDLTLEEAQTLAEERARLRAEETRNRRAAADNLVPALEVLANAVLSQAVAADTLSPEQLRSVAVLFARYVVGKAYAPPDVFEHEGVLYEVLLGHTSQSDWAPETSLTLYKPHYPAGVIPFWVAPTGAHDAPNIGDERRYEGNCWRSLINGNTTVPGSDPRWWEQFDCPAS